MAAPSPWLLLFKGLPVVLPGPGRLGQKHISCQLWIATRMRSQGCLSPHRTWPRGLAKSPLEREALLFTHQALFSLKILDHSPLPGLKNVCASNQIRFGVVWVGFFFCRSTCFTVAGSVMEGWGYNPSPPQVSSILPGSEVRLLGGAAPAALAEQLRSRSSAHADACLRFPSLWMS